MEFSFDSIVDEYSDDTYGLWEFDWQLNGAAYSRDPAKRIGLLMPLVQAGVLKVYAAPNKAACGAPLDVNEAIKVVGSYDNWAAPKPNSRQQFYFMTYPA